MRQIGDGSLQQQLLKPASNRQEAVRVGHVIVLAQHDKEALDHQKQHLLSKYWVNETAHFLICRKRSSNQCVVMHTFKTSEIDADLICFIADELASFGLVNSAKEFGAALFAVMASTFPPPRDQPMIWQRFCLNTLGKLREHIAHPLPTPPVVSYIFPFATIYRRVFELFTGQSLLDVGCSFGFLPVLIAEQVPNTCIMGCDSNPDALGFSTALADAAGMHHVGFSLQDVRNATLRCLGTFDTVTALHVLEHLPEGDMPVTFTHLLQVTSKRLIVAVPFEEKVQAVYGHQQVFTLEKLHAWGKWCIDALGGAGHYWCEEVMGGMLIVDRSSEEE